MMSEFTLIIGNKNVSSWSLRGWLALKHAQIEFEEILINLRPAYNYEKLLALTPAGKVPAVKISDEDFIWDSLAIVEYFNDLYPEKEFWPKDIKERAHARSISAEMHSGFQALRSIMPMDCLNTYDKPEMTAELKKDIERVITIWSDCRKQYTAKGPFLFGKYSAADMMYAPVVFRLKGYQIDLPDIIDEYCNTVIAHPDVQEWLIECDANDKG
jgi:glutathione S-transferase